MPPLLYDPCTLARKSLGAYAALVNPKFEIPPHIDILIQALEQVVFGDINLLAISMPPRHGKSLTTTNLFPSWYHGLFPDRKLMLGCHTQSLANRMGEGIRRNVTSREHEIVFPGCRIAKESRAKHDYLTTAGGEFVAAGMLAPPTGRGADLLMIDDPIKGLEALSPVQRTKLHEIFEAGWRTRLQPGGKVIYIGTRWHENDLIGWLLDANFQEEVDDWYVLSMPALAEHDEGWRKEGEPLWPEKFSLKTLEKIKRSKNQWVWAALYQQRPSAIEGMLFKRSWWGEYVWNPHMAASRNLGALMTQPFQIVQSWDTAFEEGEENDYCVCITSLITSSGEYILDVYRKRMIAPDLFDRAVELAIYWRASVVLVEKKSSGHSLVQHLKKNPKTKLVPVVGCIPKGSKLVRASAISPYVKNGNVYLPANAPWKKDFLDEVSGFPTSAHDDQMDAFSQLENWVYEQRHALQQYSQADGPMESQVNLFDV